MPLADVTNTHHHRSANSRVVAPQKRVSSATSATNTATKLTDMFGKKNVSSQAAASSSSKTDEEEDFFASCAKDEAVVRKGTAPLCFTRLFLLLSCLFVVSMRDERARARQLLTSLFFFHKLSLTVFRPPLLCYTKKNVNSETDDGGTSAGETPESSEESRRRRRRRLGELGMFVFVHHRWRARWVDCRSRTKTAEEGFCIFNLSW